MKFQEKVIIITGGSTGIGAATASLFREQGAKVYNLDIQKSADPNIETLICDVSQFEEVANAFDKVCANSNLDYLFVNAGIHLFANIEDTSLEDLDSVVNINLKGTFYALKCALPIMKKQNNGSIVLMGSDQSFIGKQESAIYGATKAAIAQLAKSTAIDYAKYNIRINCICPGSVDTPLLHKAVKNYAQKTRYSPESVYEALKTAQPIQRLASPREISDFVAYLLSEQASFITGSALNIDGGYVAQ